MADFDVLFNIKENVIPVPEGQPVLQMAEIFALPPSELREHQAEEKKRYESLISESNTLDDPLEPYVDYVKWICTNFPLVPPSLGLIPLLEKTTSQFLNYEMYKNDPRYLKMWILYSRHCEDPLAVYAFLASRAIGVRLASFYKERAKAFLVANRLQDACDTLYEGINSLAEPRGLLEPRLKEYLAMNPTEDHTRPALAEKGGAPSILGVSESAEKPKAGFSVFVDESEAKSQMWESFGTMATRTKENKLPAVPWSGQVLAQKTVKSAERVSVYKDWEGEKPVYKIVETPGKKTEKLDINLDLLCPEEGEEFCLPEILAKMRGVYNCKVDILDTPFVDENQIQEEEDFENNTVIENAEFKSSKGLAERFFRSGSQVRTIGSLLDMKDNIDEFKETSFLQSTQKIGLCSPRELDADSDNELLAEKLSGNVFTSAGPSDDVSVDNLCLDEELPRKDRKWFETPMQNVSTTETTTIKLKSDAGVSIGFVGEHSEIQKSPTVTMTMFTKEARKEVQSMFKQKVGPVTLDSFVKPETDHTFGHGLDEFTDESGLNTNEQEDIPKELKAPAEKASFLPYNDCENDVSQLENDVAELSVLEPTEQELPKTRPVNDPFLLTPIKRPLNDSSRKGLPFLKKKIKNMESQGENLFLLDTFKWANKANKVANLKNGVKAVDPFSDSTKNRLLTSVAKPMIESFQYLSRYNSNKDALKALQNSKKGPKHITFEKTNAQYRVVRVLGSGAYGKVFLVENSRSKNLYALKAESPATAWEFYAIQVAKQRIEQKSKEALLIVELRELSDISKNGIIGAHGLHLYRDESYLVLQYEDLGSIVDLVNCVRAAGSDSGLHELIVMHMSVQLLRTIHMLHSCDILHGDIKADNCMVRFEDFGVRSLPVASREQALQYLSRKKVTLIDFGRAVDLQLFEEKTEFRTVLDGGAAKQDCPALRAGHPWKYDVDYYGLANVIHTMLFGEYIDTIERDGKWSLKRRFKRYWQQNIWEELFECLLNEKKAGVLQNWKEKLEEYLVEGSGGFKRMNELQNAIFDMEYSMSLTRKEGKGIKN